MGSVALHRGKLLLPELTKPAAAAQILKGYQAISQSGSRLTGTYALPTLTNPAAAGEIVAGKQAINQQGAVLTGTDKTVHKETRTLEMDLNVSGNSAPDGRFAYVTPEGELVSMEVKAAQTLTISVLSGSLIVAGSRSRTSSSIFLENAETGENLNGSAVPLGYGSTARAWVMQESRHLRLTFS